MRELLDSLIRAGYVLKPSKGGGQIKVTDSGARTITAFSITDGVEEAKRRLANKGVVLPQE